MKTGTTRVIFRKLGTIPFSIEDGWVSAQRRGYVFDNDIVGVPSNPGAKFLRENIMFKTSWRVVGLMKRESTTLLGKYKIVKAKSECPDNKNLDPTVTTAK